MAHSTPAFPRPYREDSINTMYELLFCDDISLFAKGSTAVSGYPWDILLAPSPDVKGLQKVSNDDSLDSRIKLLAFDTLRKHGQYIQEKELLGVIVELGLEEGLDVLAAYLDGSARYINYTGKMILWDAHDKGAAEIIARLFMASLNIVHRIGPWTDPRRPHPPKGVMRISFLVSDGLYFGEGPINVLFNDALAAPALSSATELMQFLTRKE